jgi:hypothetical protein
MLLYKNDTLLNFDNFTIEKDQEYNQAYIITLEELDIYEDNTISLYFLDIIFLENQDFYLSKITLLIPAQNFTEDIEDSDNYDITYSIYSSEELERADQVEGVSNGVSIACYVSAAVSLASGGSNAWSMLSTIQILSFLPLLQVEMPLILRSYLRGQESYNPAYDLFREFFDDSIRPYKKAKEFKYEYSNLILNIGKPLFVLLIIMTIHLISNILMNYSQGALKLIFERVNSMFKFGVYIRFFIQMYIEFLVPALLELLYVRNI